MILLLAACREEPAGPTDGTDGTEPGPAPITWSEDCRYGLSDCGFVEVPYDHADPGGDTFPMPVGRIRHRADGPAAGVILANFGGPGADGLPRAAMLAALLGEVVDDRDVAAFDPRGGGFADGGDALGCARDVALLDAVLDRYDGSTDEASLAALIEAQRAFFDACRASDPALVDHLGMAAWAGDVDWLRRALGVEVLDWYGTSAGTSVGLAWADAHPEHAGRVVLDSVMPAYGGLETYARHQAAGTAIGVGGWADWCATDPGCAVGDDPLGALAAVLDRAATDPLVVDGRRITWGRAAFAVSAHLYSDLAWVALGRILDDARRGDGATLSAAADAFFGRTADGFAEVIAIYYLTGCADVARPPTTGEIAAQVAADEAAVGTYGGMTRLNALDTTWCAAWGPGADPLPGPARAAGAPPFLLLGNTGDFATPLAAAEEVLDALENDSVLLVQEKDAHVALFNPAGPCVLDAVRGFYAAGDLPADGARCP